MIDRKGLLPEEERDEREALDFLLKAENTKIVSGLGIELNTFVACILKWRKKT